MKIGIFGGTFDPFTVAHAAIVQKALESLDMVYVVPTTVNYYRKDKRYLFTIDEKAEIIQDFLCGISGKAEVSLVEKGKSSKWRTIDTVEVYHKKHPRDELYLILGEDSYREFETWFRFEDILQLARLMVFTRKEGGEFDKYSPEVVRLKGFENVSATSVREKLMKELMDMYLSDREYYADI